MCAGPVRMRWYETAVANGRSCKRRKAASFPVVEWSLMRPHSKPWNANPGKNAASCSVPAV